MDIKPYTMDDFERDLQQPDKYPLDGTQEDASKLKCFGCYWFKDMRPYGDCNGHPYSCRMGYLYGYGFPHRGVAYRCYKETTADA